MPKSLLTMLVLFSSAPLFQVPMVSMIHHCSPDKLTLTLRPSHTGRADIHSQISNTAGGVSDASNTPF